ARGADAAPAEMRLPASLAAATVAAGLGLTAYGVSTRGYVQPPVPSVHQPPGSLGSPVSAHPGTQTRSLEPSQAPGPHSRPASVSIPAVSISSPLGPERGLNRDATIDDAPLTGSTWSLPWWFDGGPSPGQDGSAVLLGHVDSAEGAGHIGVFFRLGAVKPGDTITVKLADGRVTRWFVSSTILYSDHDFPDNLVYSRSGGPILRLVTCGGTFDQQTHHYESSVVVTALPIE
ncbi:MAG: sortase domain-containing protein, partial [Acidimicrobiales bacterium]